MNDEELRPIRELVSELSRLRRQQRKTERNADLRFAAIDGGTGISVVDPESGEETIRVGPDEQGNPVVEVVDPNPPGKSSPPSMVSGIGALTVMWDGLTADGERARRGTLADIHMSTEEDFEPFDATLKGTIENVSGSLTVLAEPGTWQVRLRLRNQAGESSEWSEAAEVVIDSAMDDWNLQQELSDIRKALVETIMAQGNRDGLDVPTVADSEGAEDGVIYYRRESMPDGPAFEMYQLQDGEWVLLELTDGVFRHISTDKLIAGTALIGSTLIGPESITTPHLDVTESMSAAIGEFLKVKAEMLDVDHTDPTTGYRIRITPEGIRFWDSEGNLAMSIATDSPQLQRIFDAVTGSTVLSMDETGALSARTINAEESFTVQGRELQSVLNDGPKGIVPGSRAIRNMVGLDSTATEWGFLEMSFTAEAGREYALVVQPFAVWGNGETTMFRLRQGLGAEVPTVNSYALHIQSHRAATGTLASFGGRWIFSSQTSGRASFLLSLSNPQGINFAGDPHDRIRAWAEDIGPLAPDYGGRNRNSTPGNPQDAAALPPGIYQQGYQAASWRSYYSNGAEYTDPWTPQWRIHQGRTAGGSRVWSATAFGLDPSVFTGAAITGASVSFTVSGTSLSSGAWIDLNLHGHGIAPAAGTFPTLTYVGQWFAKEGQRITVNIPQQYLAGFGDGTYRGVGFGNGSTESGRTAHIAAQDVQLSIEYQK